MYGSKNVDAEDDLDHKTSSYQINYNAIGREDSHRSRRGTVEINCERNVDIEYHMTPPSLAVLTEIRVLDIVSEVRRADGHSVGLPAGRSDVGCGQHEGATLARLLNGGPEGASAMNLMDIVSAALTRLGARRAHRL